MIKSVSSIFFTFFLLCQNAFSLELIRDTELENFTNDILLDLTKDTDIDINEINLRFVNSKQVNAFVTSGKDMFINTGLITAADNYLELTSVIAHELSHMTGFHVSRTKEEISRLSKNIVPIYILGILSAIGGSADTAIASVMVGNASLEGGYFSYSRTQESAADQGAIRLMCQNSIDASGLLSFFMKLQKIEDSTIEINPYNQSHPATKERYNFTKNSLAKYGGCEYPKNTELEKRFNLLKAKLIGYTYSQDEVRSIHNTINKEGKYAIAVSSYYNNFSDEPIELLSGLIKEESNNPYFHELLAEILFSRNEVEKAVYHQKLAIDKLNKESDIFYMMMGRYLKEGDPASNEAIKYLKKSIKINPFNTYSWFLIADLYSEKNLPLAHYATAERYFLLGDIPMAYKFVTKSLKEIEKNTPEWYRANDLLHIITRNNNSDSNN